MTSPQPRKAQPIELAPDVTRRAAARCALREAHAHFRSNASALAATDGPALRPELVHQARVGLRRLRVFVRLFRVQLGKKRARQLEAELGWLFGKLGRVRDLQVFGSSMLPSLDPAPQTLKRVQISLEREHSAASAELTAALLSERFQELARALTHSEARLESGGSDKRAAARLARRLSRRHARVLAAGHALASGDVVALHELRKQLKKLRYTSELAAGLCTVSEKRRRTYQKAQKELQRDLGQLNDLVVARRLMLVLVPARAPRTALTGRLEQRLSEARARLARSFERFERQEPSWN